MPHSAPHHKQAHQSKSSPHALDSDISESTLANPHIASPHALDSELSESAPESAKESTREAILASGGGHIKA